MDAPAVTLAGTEPALAEFSAKAARRAAAPAVPDWSLPARRPFWLPRRTAAFALTQFYQGELATAEICAALSLRLESPAARAFLETQIADERRHATFYRRYAELAGLELGDAPALAEAYAAARDWQGPPVAVVLAVHAVLEVENLRLQRTVARWLPCPLLADIGRVVAVDEARHVAFGRLYAPAALAELSPEDLRLARIWLADLWASSADRIVGHFKGLRLLSRFYGVDDWRRTAWAEQRLALADLGLAYAEDELETAA